MSFQMSAPKIIPSGLYALLDQIQSVNSFTLFASIISFASLRGNVHILALLGVSNFAHSIAPFLPCSSWSKQK